VLNPPVRKSFANVQGVSLSYRIFKCTPRLGAYDTIIFALSISEIGPHVLVN